MLFQLMKSRSIKQAIKENIEALEAGVVDPHFYKPDLPVNISQAKALDISKGNVDNAKVAVALARKSPGGEENNCTGFGPARISPGDNASSRQQSHRNQAYGLWLWAFPKCGN